MYRRGEGARPREFERRDPEVCAVVTVHEQSVAELERSLNSITSQDYPALQIVYVDDASSRPETVAFLRHIERQVDKILRFPRNQGVVRARNAGLDLCNGKYVFFLDPDDELMPGFVRTLVQELERTNSSRTVAAHGDVLMRKASTIPETLWKTSPICPFRLIRGNTVPLTTLIRVETAREVGGFSEEFERGLEDWEFWLKVANRGYTSLRVRKALYAYQVSNTGRDATVNLPYLPGLKRLVRRKHGKAVVLNSLRRLAPIF